MAKRISNFTLHCDNLTALNYRPLSMRDIGQKMEPLKPFWQPIEPPRDCRRLICLS